MNEEKHVVTRKRVILLLVALLGLPFTGCDDDISRSTIGVTVARPVPSAVETLQDIRANAPFRQEPDPLDRSIPFLRIRRGVDVSAFSPQVYRTLAPAVSSFFAPESMAPALDNNFSGLVNPSTGSDIIPPDTMGVAGPSHLVSILNSEFGVFDKTGNLLSRVTLGGFWASLGTGTGQPANRPFDPKVLFDQHSGRFVAISAGGVGSPNSWILIAVSSSSNPLENWIKVAIDADTDNGSTQTGNWADFPTLGIDDANIYVCANMFNNSDIYQYSKVWVIQKSQLLNGPPGNLNWTEFIDPSGSNSTLQPAHTFGTPGAQYFVYEWNSGLLRLARVAFPGGTPTWNVIGTVAVNSFTSTAFLPEMPQLGNLNAIDTGDTRLLNAVYRNGSLWTTHHVESGGKIEVAWYRINPSSVTISMQGRISDPSRWYVFPSIAVNQDNDAAVGFSGSAATEYAGAYYTLRRSGDPSGTMQPVSLLKSGEAPYFKTLSGSSNRWGDYSATCVDPSDNVSFWTLQEYAETQSGGRSMWGTWWGRIGAASLGAPNNFSATAVSPSRIDLSWTDQSANETGFQVERKTGAGGTYVQAGTAAANATTFMDSVGLEEGTTYFYRVRAVNAGGNSAYSNEASATTQVSPPVAPANLSAATISPTRIDLSWTDQSANEAAFQVERKSGAGGTYVQLGTSAANGTTFIDSVGLEEGTTYFYRVRAVNAGGNSAYSNDASATTPSTSNPVGVGGGGGGGGCSISLEGISTGESPLGIMLALFAPVMFIVIRKKIRQI